MQCVRLGAKLADAVCAVEHDSDECQREDETSPHVHGPLAGDDAADDGQHRPEQSEGSRRLESANLFADLLARHGLSCHVDPLVTQPGIS